MPYHSPSVGGMPWHSLSMKPSVQAVAPVADNEFPTIHRCMGESSNFQNPELSKFQS